MKPTYLRRAVATAPVIRAALRQALGVSVALLLLSPAQAQDEPASQNAQAQEANGLAEVVVTARKRDEALLDTPLSVQAFTSEDIASAGLRNLEDVSAMTAGLNFQKLGNSQAGRYNSAIRFRGLELLVTTPTSQTGSLFIDGVYILGGAASMQFTDVERIEVIRGPQAAYFGRGTFGGAINYVTADPASSFGGRTSFEYSPNFGSTGINGSIEGPLGDTLSGRLSVSSSKRGAMFTATDGGALGEERTDMITGTLLWQPSDALKVKVRALYGEDDDGPASSTFVPFRLYGNCPIGTPITVKTTTGEVATTMRRDLHCGSVPVVPVSNNTTFYTVDTTLGPQNTYDIMVLNNGLPPTDTPAMDHFGLRSIFHLYTGSVDYDFNDALTMSVLLGYNKRDTTQIRDDDSYDTMGRVTKGFLSLESTSVEARLYYDGGNRLRGMIGVNYFDEESFGDIDGGIGLVTNLLGPPSIGSAGGSIDAGKTDTSAVFASVEYDLLENLTLSLEGRYQDIDTETLGGAYPGPYTTTKSKHNNTLPRFLVNFKPFESTTLYANYSEGALGGSRNTAFAIRTPAEKEVILAQVPGVSEQLAQQKLESYEIGWKQSLGSSRSWFSLSAYQMDWTNIPGSAQVTFISPTTGNAVSIGVTLPGDAELKGIEAELRWQPLDQLALHASGGYIDAKYTDFISAGLNSYFGLGGALGSYKADGATLPRSPQETFALSATWTDTLNSDWDWYVRGDATYAGKAYTDETNLSWIGGYSLLNSRIGFARGDGLNIELFCRNCLNEDGWRTGRRAIDWFDTAPLPNFLTRVGSLSQPMEKREIGLRVQFEF
ncbi:MAG TPA: TonB-dependent receptor [Steroidobacteraceae bacterium]|nr:TonB-dependent receptor [Steroidobacteraceae bacterium]